ncbi:MAG: 50S ribosomal protein L5 [Candidatus Cyclonatronum sp.]|uniref:50S ribosomal protein L5 n=1 Tax=Cyclonatronum sp. TaxID=3024185 RepID=UPI0025B922D9|nr:50S ribosomal protein L5 [Cyclonatronum sp.]MCC5935003.1 50S ribosomal protein L5 [Balneolales bacterium]MCH8487451.1 50S ribosomal protein L5 [Cyclonatronum sp.]
MAEARLYTVYKNEIVPQLIKDFSLPNIMAVPKIEKIVINVGVGEAITDRKRLDDVAANIALITGQKPVLTKARKSISNFKLREQMPIGCKVTLRQSKMYEFIDRLINLALPRTRDFQGVSDKGFDGRGNFSMGVKEHSIFPEIDTDKLDQIHGMNITFVTTAENDEQAIKLLKAFGMPFVKRNKN